MGGSTSKRWGTTIKPGKASLATWIWKQWGWEWSERWLQCQGIDTDLHPYQPPGFSHIVTPQAALTHCSLAEDSQIKFPTLLSETLACGCKIWSYFSNHCLYFSSCEFNISVVWFGGFPCFTAIAQTTFEVTLICVIYVSQVNSPYCQWRGRHQDYDSLLVRNQGWVDTKPLNVATYHFYAHQH